MSTYPEITDGDPEHDLPSHWSNDSLAEAAERLASWHDRQRNRNDPASYVQHELAAGLVRELMERLPPFALNYSTPRKGPDADRTTVEIAGHKVERTAGGLVVAHKGTHRIVFAILEACERAHAKEGRR
jgi:hypothetical protein